VEPTNQMAATMAAKQVVMLNMAINYF